MSRIVTIHSVDERTYPPERLVRYIRTMRSLGWDFVSIGEVLSEKCKKKSIALTFDDAYKSCLMNAMPILKELNVPALMFVPTGLLGLPANHPLLIENACYEDESVMTEQEVEKWMENGFEIGFHTHMHTNLYAASNNMIQEDFQSGMELFAKRGWKTEFFAYPFGFLPKDRAFFEGLLHQYGFSNAFTINWGKVDTSSPFYVNRVCLGNKENFWWSVMKTIGIVDIYFNNYRIRKEQKL